MAAVPRRTQWRTIRPTYSKQKIPVTCVHPPCCATNATPRYCLRWHEQDPAAMPSATTHCCDFGTPFLAATCRFNASIRQFEAYPSIHVPRRTPHPSLQQRSARGFDRVRRVTCMDVFLNTLITILDRANRNDWHARP